LAFLSVSEELTDIFITESEIIDRYVGGTLWNWGLNSSGQLGDNNPENKSSPVQTVSGGTNWKQVSVGSSHAAAIKTDGTLWLWGDGSTGLTGDNTTTSRSSPVQTVSSGANWKQVSAGATNTAAIKTDGTLWAWGLNQFGGVGDNTTISRSSPVQTVSSGTNWKQVSAGGAHTAAIKTDGTLWLWGSNVYGRLGDNSNIPKSSPVQTVSSGTNWKQVSAASFHTAAIKTDGTLWLWGFGENIGDNSAINKSSPVQTVSSGTNWKQVSAGGLRTTAIKTDGTLWLWGRGEVGGLGNNSIIDRSSPVQTISSGTNWKQVDAGHLHVAAIKTDGTLWLWGWNSYKGQLGDNTAIDRSSPVQTVSSGANWKQVSGGSFSTAAVEFC